MREYAGPRWRPPGKLRILTSPVAVRQVRVVRGEGAATHLAI